MAGSLHAGVGGLDADSREVADPARQGGYGIIGGIQGDADDADAPGAVGDAHAADDVFAVLMQNLVHGLDRFGVLDDDADDGNSGFH